MLTLVINPGGTRRVVTIAEALYYLGVEIRVPNHRSERTPEERRRHRAELRREYQRRMQDRPREAER